MCCTLCLLTDKGVIGTKVTVAHVNLLLLRSVTRTSHTMRTGERERRKTTLLSPHLEMVAHSAWAFKLDKSTPRLAGYLSSYVEERLLSSFFSLHDDAYGCECQVDV